MSKEKILEKVMAQMEQDREAIYETFKDIKNIVNADPTQYAIQGLTLAKFAELMTKQTGQVIDLVKIKDDEEEDVSLTDEDIEYIQKSISKEKQ